MIVFTDLCGDLEALKLLLAEINSESNNDKIFCLGDTIGGSNDDQILNILESMEAKNVLGHTEAISLGLLPSSNIPNQARPQIRQRIKKWPLQLTQNNALFSHSLVRNPFKQSFRYEDLALDFNYFDQRILFAGHTEQPMLLGKTDQNVIELKWEWDKPVQLFGIGQIIAKVPSLQRTNPYSGYVTWDKSNDELTFKKLSHA